MKSTIKKLSLILLTVTGVWSMQSCTEGRGNSYCSKTKVDVNGLNFIKTAHEAGLTEIEASKVAKQKSTNKAVTDFADMMINDHTKAGADVDTLASQKFVMVTGAVNYDHKVMIDSLSKKTGTEFDKAYMEMMVADHEEAVELFKDNETSTYPEIREIVKKTLQTLKKHLAEAKSINASLK